MLYSQSVTAALSGFGAFKSMLFKIGYQWFYLNAIQFLKSKSSYPASFSKINSLTLEDIEAF